MYLINERLYLGSDAVDIVEKTLLDRLEVLRKWKEISLQSDKEPLISQFI